MHRARDRQRGGALVALKHMYLQQEGVLPLHVQRELEVLRGVHDPALVSLLDVRQEVGARGHWQLHQQAQQPCRLRA